ncbi:hypothetical protein PICMEDRAFT_58623 [Pichia membranifaciens NRRL Y-2026]|uniref:B30.2/SPRY domain-containing protein n=1 Tax=Pichia membranifaciens NRRL Y-2026 TaxID=763406 RepID=A0A1E3NJI3_9ASCO|nr:hypothetical protein PICMEDRAFT_58623 [Pichia membranifaciens NRRL Y-2026]ODQ46270.1 hypothetical protein PICMEDRAFT_58623 [Pichia membranifaciens NRRL Y-2026]
MTMHEIQQQPKDRLIPRYIQFQFLSNHIENELSNTSPDMLPDALRWRKISYLASLGYLGRYPGYFFDGSVRNEDYLNKVLNMNIISQEEDLYSTGDSHFAGNHSLLSSSKLGSIGGATEISNTDGSYYMEGNINWNSRNNLDDDWVMNHPLNVKDLSLPTRIDMPKTETKVNLSDDEKTVGTELIENTMFNLYPRGNNKSNFVTIPLDSYVSPLLCIYYYEITVIKGIEDECDIVIGYVKDEIKNIAYTSSSMIDLRGTDDRAVGWYGKNGIFTLWNDKRIEKSACRFGKGDVVGMGYNLYRDVFFITKNGLLVSELPSLGKFLDKSFEGRKNVRGFVPSVSLGSWCKVRINLGDAEDKQKGFRFDIESYVKKNKYNFVDKIKLSKIPPFSLPNKKVVKNDLDLTHYVDELVIGFLKYGGYLDTVKEMQEDLKALKRKEDPEDGYMAGLGKADNMLLELCHLKKMVKKYVMADELLKVRNLLETKYPGFFTTYRKINFRLKILKLIRMLISEKTDILKCVKFASQLKNLFKEEDCQYYIDQVSVLFSHENPRNCPEFHLYYDDNKTKIIHAIIMAINEQNRLPFISSLDLVILRTDQNLEAYVDKVQNGDKGPLLINMLEDYIKF